MKKLAAMLVVCGACSMASAWNLWTNASALMRGVAAAEANSVTEETLSPIPCLTAFSKDDCEGVVEPGTVSAVSCPSTGCRTIIVRGAKYSASMQSSNQGCTNPGNPASCFGKCDEFRDGRLTLSFNYVLRADSCCPYRGSWEGKWQYVTDAGRVYTGTAHGTIGVGTNRKSACPLVDDACENCYDVQRTDANWLIGFEGSFRGTSLLSTTLGPDELNFTMDGTWAPSALVRDPFSQPFRVRNRFDGVSITYCQ